MKTCMEKYLEICEHEEYEVSVYLTNGVRLTGYVIHYDSTSLIMQNDKNGEMVVNLHNISSINANCDEDAGEFLIGHWKSDEPVKKKKT